MREAGVRALCAAPAGQRLALRRVGGVRGREGRKGTRWMPRREGPMKGVVSCEKPRGAASRR